MGRMQIVMFVAIAALLWNGQCLARCLAMTPCQIADQSADTGCHHSSHSKRGGGSHCSFEHHSEMLGKLPAATILVPATTPAPVSLLVVGARFPETGIVAERALPPDKPLFLLNSILRL